MFPILLIIISFFILILLEPDFGTDMVIMISLIGLIFVSGTKFSIFFNYIVKKCVIIYYKQLPFLIIIGIIILGKAVISDDEKDIYRCKYC